MKKGLSPAQYSDGSNKSEKHGKRGPDSGVRPNITVATQSAKDMKVALKNARTSSAIGHLRKAEGLNDLLMRAAILHDDDGKIVFNEKGQPTILDYDILQICIKAEMEMAKLILPYTHRKQPQIMSDKSLYTPDGKPAQEADDLEFDDE